MRASTKILIAILLIAAFLRLWGLTRGDPVNDEVLMGFRSIGLIDFDLAEFQTTPWEWFDPHTITQHCAYGAEQNSAQVVNHDTLGSIPLSHMQKVCNAVFSVGVDPKIPWWTRLSWHDHPPLVFYVQHLSFALFGENLFALRFPSALLGIASVYLIYLLGKRLSQTKAGNNGLVNNKAEQEIFRKSRVGARPNHSDDLGGKDLRKTSCEALFIKPATLTGLISALIFAITLNAVYISRTGMQESYTIFFILLSCYFFLRALKNPRYFIWTGTVMGLGFLAKYTVLFFTAPLFLLYLFAFSRKSLRQKKIWLCAGIILLFATPVIMYNIMLYRAVGHFDFQFSALFFQDHPAWQVQPGKDIGTVGERLSRFVPNLIATNSWLFLTLAASAIIGFCISLLRNPRATIYRHSFLIFALGTMFLLLLGIGPSYRFLTMLTPFLALVMGNFIAVFYTKIVALTSNINSRTGFEPEAGTVRAQRESAGRNPERATLGRARKVRGLILLVLASLIIFELFYSWNNQIAYYPVGSPLTADPWLFSKARYENYNWGYNELARYFEDEFRGKVPEITFDLQYQFLEQLRDKALTRGVESGKELFPALVVIYGNFDKGGKLWALDRLHIYHAWPIINLATYSDYLRERGSDFYTRSGFKYFYFVLSTNTVAVPEFQALVSGIDPVAIKNPRGDTAFLVYKITFL